MALVPKVDAKLIQSQEEIQFVESMFTSKIKLEKVYTATTDGFNG